MAKRNNPDRLERMAEILLEVALNPKQQEKIAEKHGYSVRQLQNWRKQLETDTELARIFATKKQRVSEGWADEVPSAMRATVAFLRRAAEEGDPKDPSMVHSVAGAMKLLSEVSATWRLLEVRLARSQPIPPPRSDTVAPPPLN